MQAILGYFSGAVRELNNVTWPTRKQAVTTAIMTLVFVLLSSSFIGAVDFLFNTVFTKLILK